MDGVVFHDSKSGLTARSEGPLLHHFWSSNLLAEQIYLRKCWNDCVEKKIPIPTKQFLRELKAEISQSETIVSSANTTSTGIQRAKEKTECGIDSDENNEDQEIVLDIEPVHEEDEAENTVPDDVNEGSSEAIEITGRVKLVPCIERDETPPLTSCSDSTNSSLSIKNQHGKDTVSADGNLQDITFIPNVTSTPVAASKKQCRRKPCDAEQRNTSKLGIQSSTIPNYSYNLTTKFGKALSKVLGKSEQVDKYRYMLKTKVADAAFAKEKYLDLVAILHTKVSKTLRELEKTYFINNEVSSEISAENMTEIAKAENAKEIIQKIKYAKAVIHEFETVI